MKTQSIGEKIAATKTGLQGSVSSDWQPFEPRCLNGGAQMKSVTTTITTSMPHLFSAGDEVQLFYAPCGKSRIISVSSNTITVATAPASRWARFWYYLRNPRLWKYALDIPFTPPDILVQR